MVNSDQFGKRLQRIMDEYDLNATSFADEIEVGRSSISHILSGRNKPSLEFVMKIIAAFPEVELYWLLNGKGSFPKNSSTANSGAKIQSNQLKADFDDIPSQIETEPKREDFQKPVPESFSGKDESIERIVIFYRDGTFKSFIH